METMLLVALIDSRSHGVVHKEFVKQGCDLNAR